METLTAPPAFDKIAAALAACQGELTNPPKTKTVRTAKYSYSYADLSEIIDHVRPTLAKHKLAYVQMPIIHENGKNVLHTRLMHESGQFFESTYPLPSQAAAQEMGSAITYARRYSLCAILGIAAEDDDDGAKANDAGSAVSNRDNLIELMGRDTIGNKALMDYCTANGLGSGRSTDDVTDEAVEKLLDTWADVCEAIKKAAKKPTPPKAEPPPAPPADDKPTDDLEGIDPQLAALMKAIGVTKTQLKAYYTGKKHLPATTEPEKLPKSYLTMLMQPTNWEKAVAAMKAAV